MIVRVGFLFVFLMAVQTAVSFAAKSTAGKFPYVGYVSGRNVYVRSGPGKDYYPTDQLQKGHKVMVYRHEPGGWCAIRPPEGSFSWVAARYLKPTEDQLAIVTRDKVASRIGSNLRGSRDIVSVRLRKNEEVKILGADRSGSKTWYKITPPDGEFRWVHIQFIKSDQPRGDVLQTEDEIQPAKQLSKNTKTNRDNKVAPTTFKKKGTANKIEAAWVNPKARKAQRKSGEEVRLVSNQQSRPSLDAIKNLDSPKSTKPKQLSTKPSDELQEMLDEIDAELSQRVVGDAASWQLSDLSDELAELLAQTKNVVDRGRVQKLYQKIQRFDTIGTRQRKIDNILKDTSKKNQVLDRRSKNIPVVKKAVAGSRFDGVGRLVPTRADRFDLPPFILMDDQNRPLMFVSPAPGVNLRPYTNKKVGIQGIRGYMAEQRMPYVSAKRITPLGGVAR